MPAIVESMAYVGQTPWHGLGFKLEPGATPEEMMVAAGLDWKVVREPLYYRDTNGVVQQVPKHALVRESDGHYFDTVGKDWTPTQNAEAFDFFSKFTEAGQMTMETAGSLRDGKNVFALARISKEFEVVKGDSVRGYLLFHNPHQFGKSIEVLTTNIRVVCWNTLTAALGAGSDARFSVNHRREFDPEEAEIALGIADHQLGQFEEKAKFLASRRAKKEDFEDFVVELYPSTKKGKHTRNAEAVIAALEYQPGHDLAAGTWWDALNAVTFAVDHVLGNTNDSRLASAWFGAGRAKKDRAVELAVEHAEKSGAIRAPRARKASTAKKAPAKRASTKSTSRKAA